MQPAPGTGEHAQARHRPLGEAQGAVTGSVKRECPRPPAPRTFKRVSTASGDFAGA
jgi:hypothetical protein